MGELKELFLYPITGIFDECHHIDYAALCSVSGVQPTGKYCLRQLNNVWWHEALSMNTLDLIVERLSNRYQNTIVDILQHRIALADPTSFAKAVQDAPRRLADLGGGARSMFQALESLQLFCQLYSDTLSTPFTLSLQEGLIVNELSSLNLARESLNPKTNPYLEFIERHYVPVLEAIRPNLLWIVGPIKMSTFAMAMLAKQRFPECHISVTGHSTEYYSLNKISEYLVQNTILFSVIDSIVLDDFENTELQLVDCMKGGHPLSSVPNLLYRNQVFDTGSSDVQPLHDKESPIVRALPEIVVNSTPMAGGKQSLEYHTTFHPVSVPELERSSHVDPSEVVDVRLWPNSKCYWDQCNFCAINRKYQTLSKSSFKNVEEVADYLAELGNKGVRYVWSYDEAIPPKSLGDLASVILERRMDIIWQARSKIDKHFTAEICQLLGRSGLREIRLGLESASARVLGAMGKFPLDWSLDLVERIVSDFHSSGVSVHFPTIVGFPTETDAERRETFEFLYYITRKYPSVTFNVNILGFDVASKLFQEYPKHGITMVRWPAPSKYFLGNLLDWDCEEVPFDYYSLDQQRNDLMRRLLYPWMPNTASIPVYIFYRLSETSRATMVWKASRRDSGNWKDDLPDLQPTDCLVLSSGLVISGPIENTHSSNTRRYFVYDWSSHHTFECDDEAKFLLDAFMKPSTISAALTSWGSMQTDSGSERDMMSQIKRLHRMGILVAAAVVAQ